MGKQRKKGATDPRAQIVVAVLGGRLSVAEAARRHRVNQSLIPTRKEPALQSAQEARGR